jgi:hypothetical protein
MAYYSNPNHSFNQGDRVLVVNCGNPDLSVAPGKMIVPVSVGTKRGVSHSGGRQIEQVVDENGELR